MTIQDVKNIYNGWKNVEEVSNYVEMEKKLYELYSLGFNLDIEIQTLYYGETLEDYMDVLAINVKNEIQKGIRVRIGDYYTVMTEVIESHLNEIEGVDWVV